LTSALEFDPALGENGLARLPTGFFPGHTAFDATGAILVGNGEGVARYLLDTSPVALGEDGILRVEGNDDANVLTVGIANQSFNIRFDDEVFRFAAADVAGILVTTRGGNDDINLNVDVPSTVSAGDGSDTIRITGSADDSVMTGEGSDFVQTGGGDDHIVAEEAATILSGDGDDVIGTPFGSMNGYLEIDAGAGNDQIHTNGSDSVIWAGDGNDLIEDEDSGDPRGFDRINGESGDDTINGNGGVDIITGGPGNDQIDAGLGMNTVEEVTSLGLDFRERGFTYENGVFGFVGGSDRDSVQIFADESGKGVLSHGIRFAPTGRYWATIDLSVVRLFELVGGEGADELIVSQVTIPAVIDGGAGDDEITGSAGADSLFGGEGNDSLFGDAGNDVMRGGGGDDYLEGGKGHDMLLGQAGADRLFGLDGNDTLFSNDGAADTVRGGAGTDRGESDDLDDVLGVEVSDLT